MLNIKLGDKVIYIDHDLKYRQVATVTRLSSTGDFKVNCSNSIFNLYGYKIDGDFYTDEQIFPYDESVAKKIEEHNLISYAKYLMQNINQPDLSVEDAKIIIEILKKYKKK